jgi:soluble lytic murein transglycosylase-like protein
MPQKSLPGVVLKETLVKVRKKWFHSLILTNLFYIIAIVALLIVITGEKKEFASYSNAARTIEEYRTKDKLYGILRSKGYSLGQGLDIVEAIARKSRELELPLALIMAVIDQESEFYPHARSSKGAQGLMQVMPVKWDEYVVKLDLKVDRRAMADPLMNITVGCQILKDFYDRHKHIQDHKVRMAKALTDYNNGENAAKPNLKYALQVNRKVEEYERNLYCSAE